MQDLARCRGDLLRVRVAEHSQCHRRKRTLKQIHIYHRIGWLIRPVFMHVTHDANDGEQPDVAIHVSEFNGVPDGVLARPALPREGCADEGSVGSIRAVALVKHSSTQKRNSKHLKISISCNAKIRFPESLFLAEEKVEVTRQFLQVRGLGNLTLDHQQKLAVGNASRHGQAACCTDLPHTRNLP